MTFAKQLSGKRILFVLCGFDLGGAERQALYLAKHLKESGADVRVWGHHHRKTGPEMVIKHCEEHGIPWAEYKFRWPCGKRNLVRDAWHLWLGLWRTRPDIVIPYLPWPSVGCGLVWRWTPVKVCIWGQRNVDDLRGDFVEKFAYRRASAVICNAAHEVEYLQRTLGKTLAPVHVVYNGVDLPEPEKDRQQWRAKMGLAGDEVAVIMLANFCIQKDHPSLLKAWKRITKSKVKSRLILPGAPQDSFEAIRNLALELDLNASVIFPGQIQDVAGLLRACDIGVLATANEGLPNAIIEYMTCGLPVVATDIPGNREALGKNADDQLCRKNDSEGLAEKLLYLIRSPDLRRTLGIRNRERAMREFSIEAMCNRMSCIIIDSLWKKG